MQADAFERMSHGESRGACWYCGLRRDATCHTGVIPDRLWWWQHAYEPAILTRVRGKKDTRKPPRPEPERQS